MSTSTNNTKRRNLLSRLQMEMAELVLSVESTVDSALDVEMQAAVLDEIVDVDYFLRKLAMAYGITAIHRREYARRKGEIRLVSKDKSTELYCATCVVQNGTPSCEGCAFQNGPKAVDQPPQRLEYKPCLSKGST